MISADIEFRVRIKLLAADQEALTDYINWRKHLLYRTASAHKRMDKDGVVIAAADVILATPVIIDRDKTNETITLSD